MDEVRRKNTAVMTAAGKRMIQLVFSSQDEYEMACRAAAALFLMGDILGCLSVAAALVVLQTIGFFYILFIYTWFENGTCRKIIKKKTVNESPVAIQI